MKQESFFLHGEGDRWFERNKKALHSKRFASQDPVLKIVRGLPRAREILDVGCSNGWRLDLLRRRFHSSFCAGVEPSLAAIEDGRSRFPKIEFFHGTAMSMPVKQFDLVIVSFVLCWVSRPVLLTSVAAIDRMVKKGGCLVINDFLPDSPSCVPYHHAPKEGIYTYKQNYAAFFTDSGIYREIDMFIYDHDTHKVGQPVPFYRRAGCFLLQKRTME